MSDRKLLPGKFVWFEHVSRDAKKAQEFYGEVLGWKVKPFPMGDVAYEMILNWRHVGHDEPSDQLPVPGQDMSGLATQPTCFSAVRLSRLQPEMTKS
jgi:hypothetical protein